MTAEAATPIPTDGNNTLPSSHPGMEVAMAAGVSKSFGGIQALTNVSINVRAGEVHALCGENGAGKSTLIKILSGFYAPQEGRIEIMGQPLPASVHAASELGVSVIHQESVACPDLDAVDNVFVGRELRTAGGLFLRRRAMQSQTRQLLARLGENVDVGRSDRRNRCRARHHPSTSALRADARRA